MFLPIYNKACERFVPRPSALTRRCVFPLHWIVNSAPARCCVWPDIGRHRRGWARGSVCAARTVLLPRLAFAFRLPYISIGMFYVRPTPAVCRTAPNRTACDRFRFYSAWVEIAIRAFSNVMRLSNLLGSLQASAFLSGDPDGRTESAARRGCAFAKSHWPCYAFRGENAGAARPRLRQRAIGSLDSLHLIRDKVPFCKTSQ